MKHLTMEQYIRTIKNTQDGDLSLFLGAGASIQSGIPSAGDMIWDFKKILYCSVNNISEEYYKDLQSEETRESLQSFFDGLIGYPKRGNSNEYSFYFEKCYPTIESRRNYIVNKTSGKKPSIGYLCTGALINQNVINTVITTNFDPLVEFGIKSINPLVQVASISSSITPQLSIANNMPQIVKMHGDYLYDRIQNTNEELREIEKHIAQHAFALLSQKQLLIMGYSGNDESIICWLKEGMKKADFVSKGVYWCTLKGYKVSEKVQELLNDFENNGKEVAIVEISNFDDFMFKLYNSKCEKEETIDSISKSFSSVTPFSFSSALRKAPFVKFNAFISKKDGIPQKIKCAKTSLDGYASLRTIIGDLPIIAALKKGVLYFACDDYYDDVLKQCLLEDIHTTNFNKVLLNRHNSIELSLLYDLLLNVLSNISGLRRVGKRKIINVNTEKYMSDSRYKFYEALLLDLQCSDDNVYLIITPTVEIEKSNGEKISKEERQVLANTIISQRYNNKFGELLLEWQKLINNATKFTFSCGDFALSFDKIAMSSGGYKRSDSWPMLEAYEFEEPKMQLSAQAYVNQLRGLVEDGPFDSIFFTNRAPVRVAFLSQFNELKNIYMHIYQLTQPHKCEKVDGYIVDYPGFEPTYRKSLQLPRKGSTLLATYNESISSFEDAVKYYEVLISKIDTLLDKRNDFDILIVHIPETAKLLRQKDGFDLHDAVKLYCANKQIKVQFVEDRSIKNSSQMLKIIWGLSSGIYAKSNGELWRPRYFDDQTAFIGISYSMLPDAHLHIGAETQIRIPMDKVIKPLEFVDFVVKHTYKEKWDDAFIHNDKFRTLVKKIKKQSNKVVSKYFTDDEKLQLYIT